MHDIYYIKNLWKKLEIGIKKYSMGPRRFELRTSRLPAKPGFRGSKTPVLISVVRSSQAELRAHALPEEGGVL